MRSATSRWTSALAVMFLCCTFLPANAGTVTIVSTSAGVGCIGQTASGALAASCTGITPGGTMTSAAISSVPGGHLGASAFSSIPGTASGAQAGFTMYMTVQGGEPGDVLQFDLKLDGSFSFGGGGGVQLIYDTVSGQNEVINSAVVSCNTYNELNHGTQCWQSPVNAGPGAAGNATRFFVSLDGLDSIALTGSLGVSTGPNAVPGQGVSADFYNSALLTITVPQDITIVNNPGGDLFQTASSGPVPEPGSVILFATGALGLGVARFRKHAV